jgi:hypothetical protein
MKTLKCRIGTLAFDGNIFHKGDIFETVDVMAAHLVEHKSATEYIIPEPEAPEAPKATEEPEPEEVEQPEEPELPEQPDNAAMEDLSGMNVREVTDLVKSIDDPDVLEGLLEQEQAHDNRKTVIEALESKLQPD